MRAGAQAGAQGHVARKHGVEALDLAAALDRLAAHAEDVAGPLLAGRILFLEAEFHELVEVDGIGPDLLGAVDLDLGHDAAVDGAGEHVTAVVVGVLADEVDTAGGGVQVAGFAEEGLELFLDFRFHIDCLV